MNSKMISRKPFEIFQMILVYPFQLAIKNFLRVFKHHKLKTLVVTIFVFGVVLFQVLLSILNIKNELYSDSLYAENSYSLEKDQVVNEIPNTGAGIFFLENFKKGMEAISGVLDNFISYTPDPTGRSSCSKSLTSYCEFRYQANDQFTILDDGTSMPTTERFSKILVNLVAPLGIILIIIQAFNLITSENREGLKSFFLQNPYFTYFIDFNSLYT